MNRSIYGGIAMSDKGFKGYIENRTTEDIMNDYSEQRDEWETLVVVENDMVVRFQHKNGRTFFCEQYDSEINDHILNEKMLEVLSGKTIEQQMEHFFVTESYRLYSTSYGEIDKQYFRERAMRLCNCKEIKKLLIKDKILIGAKIDGYWGEGVLLLDSPVCTYYASDNEGSGTKDREDYAFLIFVDKL